MVRHTSRQCVILFGSFVLAWAVTAWLLHANWRDKERRHLDGDTAVLATTYRASVEMFGLATETVYANVLSRPDVIDAFASGVRAPDEAAQAAARGRLYRLVAPAYAHLSRHGFRQLQFHTAASVSFLRMHDPAKFGDPLVDVRPAVKIANTEKRAVSGFEQGRYVTGFRYVFPLFQGEEHLGSVETSVGFRQMRDAMNRIDAARDYAFVLRRDRLDATLFAERRALYDTAPIHADFVVEDPDLKLPDAAPPPAAARLLDTRLATDSRVREGMAAGLQFTVALQDGAADWAISFVPVKDVLERDAGYVIAYTAAPLVAVLRAEFARGLLLAAGVLGLLAWFGWRLLHSRDALVRDQERIRQLAWYDSLTGLPNRALLQDRLGVATAGALRDKETLATLFLDLDQFKNINDSLGHAIGDRLLQQVALRIADCVRTSDTVARLGGDEFVIIMPNIRAPADAAFLAEKILAAVARPYVIDGHELYITPSIGIAICPEDGCDFESLIQHADAAMYLAKEHGRNNYQYFTAALNARAVERLSLESALRGALERRELSLHYQPQINLASGAIIGVEALLRWRHPVLGWVAPDRFIPVAEDSGLIVPIGAWVLQEACRQARAWQAAGLAPLLMAVNVSGVQFHQADLAETVRDILAEHGLAAASLEIEVTESVLMKSADSAVEILRKFREMGVRLAIDDFGTGYSSLSYLKRFPIDKLKIDRSFVSDITTDPDDAAIASAIIAMAHRLRLKVIAEGVETPGHLGFLLQEGCDEAQGYHYSKPLPPDDLERLMRGWQG
ncbi:MAG: bifunctional diguanylate cyclase/phosphodiesterase [Rhodocyclaceae bacterium]